MNYRPLLVVLSGAGISAESGLKTFRDSDGLWENYRIEDVATPDAFESNPELVLEFYNLRRRQLATVAPNEAHKAIAQAEKWIDVVVVTQNIDDLHERAGSSRVVHLHGKLTEACSSYKKQNIIDIGYSDILLGQKCSLGYQLRPNIVWFGEEVPLLETGAHWVSNADYVLVVGTSLNVYPAAQLIYYARKEAKKVAVDPSSLSLPPDFMHIKERAGTGVRKALDDWFGIV
jgi:NAD-dependent deacetylase